MMSEASSITNQRPSGGWQKAIILAAIVLAVAFSLIALKPAAPKEISLLTGVVGSHDHQLGLSLAGYLEEEGLQVEVSPTSGGMENLLLLASGVENTVAFVTSSLERALDEPVDTGQLASLGSVTQLPLWLFYRNGLQILRIPDIAGHAVSLGPEKSTVGHISRLLLDINDIDGQVKSDTIPIENPVAVSKALLKGEIDAAFAIGNPSNKNISTLLSAENISFLSFERADAYQMQSEAISTIRVPEGLLDLARNIPSREMTLLTITTNLVTNDTFSAAAVPVLLQAVSKVNMQHQAFGPNESFPNANNVTLPLAKAAVRYYSQGEKGLSKFLPYKVTRWLNHLGFVVLPLLTILVVLLKIFPVLLKVQASIKFNGLYKKLEKIEKAYANGTEPLLIHREIDLLDKASASIFVPRSMREQFLNLRQIMHDMRERVPGVE